MDGPLKVIFTNLMKKNPYLKQEPRIATDIWVLSIQIFQKNSHLAPAAIIERGLELGKLMYLEPIFLAYTANMSKKTFS